MTATPAGERRAQRLLQQAGVAESPMDPLSLQALQKFLETGDTEESESDYDDDDDVVIEMPSPPRSTNRTAASDLANLPDAQRILALLERQTEMIEHLQDRVDELTQMVQGQSSGAPTPVRRNVPRALQFDAAAEEVRPPQPAVARREPPPPPADAPAPQPGWLDQFQSFPDRLRQSRASKILILFLALRRRRAPEFDVTMLVKIVFMLAVLLARMPEQRAISILPLSRFQMLSMFVIGGYMVQTGLLQFLYQFFVKEGYAERIWNGEEIDVEREARPAPPRPAPVQAQVEQPAEEEQPAEPPSLFREFFVFLTSFFLSIFPMWQPEAPPPPREAAPPEAAPPIQEEDEDMDEGL